MLLFFEGVDSIYFYSIGLGRAAIIHCMQTTNLGQWPERMCARVPWPPDCLGSPSSLPTVWQQTKLGILQGFPSCCELDNRDHTTRMFNINSHESCVAMRHRLPSSIIRVKMIDDVLNICIRNGNLWKKLISMSLAYHSNKTITGLVFYETFLTRLTEW